MPFTTPDFNAISAALLRDVANQLPGANVASDGDYAIRANATGAAIEGLYQHQQWIVRQLFPDTADADYLEIHTRERGLTRKLATAAAGTMTFSGIAGSAVPVGTEVKTSDGVSYLTTAAGVIGVGGSVSVAAQASSVGITGNQAAATALTLTAAPAGVLSSAVIATMAGGADVETDADLLVRLLFLLRNPPCGGAAHDYYSWAMAVDGVTAAYVYPNRRGLGTTDVLIMATGGIPGEPMIAAVQAYINTLRPVTLDFLALAPTPVPVNIAAVLTLTPGVLAVAAPAAISAALATYFARLKPGETVYLSRLRAIISNVAGVVDFNLTAPVANTVALVDATHSQLATLGTTTWS